MAETQEIVPHSEDHVSVAGEPSFVTGLLYKVEREEKDKYAITQVREQEHFQLSPPPPGSVPIDVTVGDHVRIVGWVYPANLTINVVVYIGWAKIGEFYGNLNQGPININVTGGFATGTIKIFTRNGRDVWVNVKLRYAGFLIEGEYIVWRP